jgi:hypothetical protein
MKWFGRWILRQIQKANDDDEPRIRPVGATMKVSARDIDSEEGLNIMVRKAMGGKIVTFRTYDHKADRHNHKIYVIPEDHDFERELGKLITLESMRM